MSIRSSFSSGYAIALGATLLWSTTEPFISYLSRTYPVPSLVLAFWRDLFVSFGMTVELFMLSLFLQEILAGAQLIGSLFVFTGVILLCLEEKPEPAPLME